MYAAGDMYGGLEIRMSHFWFDGCHASSPFSSSSFRVVVGVANISPCRKDI